MYSGLLDTKMTAKRPRMDHGIKHMRNMPGTFSATSGGKSLSWYAGSGGLTGRLLGLAIAVVMNPKKNEPKP